MNQREHLGGSGGTPETHEAELNWAKRGFMRYRTLPAEARPRIPDSGLTLHAWLYPCMPHPSDAAPMMFADTYLYSIMPGCWWVEHDMYLSPLSSVSFTADLVFLFRT